MLKGAALLLLFIFAIQLSQQYWTFVLLGAGILMSWWGLSAYRHKRRRQEEMLCEIRGMDKEKFAQYTADLLQSQGYQVQPMGKAGGSELLLMRDGEKLPCWLKQRQVTKNEIAEIIKNASSQDCSGVVIITAASFTRGAAAMARRRHCILIDREGLVALILQHRQGHRVLPFRRGQEEGGRSSAGAD